MVDMQEAELAPLAAQNDHDRVDKVQNLQWARFIMTHSKILRCICEATSLGEVEDVQHSGHASLVLVECIAHNSVALVARLYDRRSHHVSCVPSILWIVVMTNV